MKTTQLRPHFVDSIPEDLDSGVLYVSMSLASAIHLCACGCGQEVITPLSPTDWKLWFDGENVSLEPSIGNWSFGCRSHYWIRGGAVRWAGSWSSEQISSGRAHDRERKNDYYQVQESVRKQQLATPSLPPNPDSLASVPRSSWMRRFWTRLIRSK